MTNYTTSTPTIDDPSQVYGLLGVGVNPPAPGDPGGVLLTPSSLLSGIKTIYESVKNVDTVTLDRGTPVCITGNTGQEANVIRANASTNFPANFVLAETLAPGGSGQAVALGFINNVSVPDASLFTAGQEVYLGAGGGWTTTRPTGAANIQLLGNIVKVNTNNNTISGIFAPQNIEYLPNLTQGKIWVGNASGVPEEVTLGQSPEVITTPTGIIYRFTQPTKPIQRAPGVSLGIGDQWKKSDDGTEWFWNGTYWLSSVERISSQSVVGFGGSATPLLLPNSSLGAEQLFVTRLKRGYWVATANASNYWESTGLAWSFINEATGGTNTAGNFFNSTIRTFTTGDLVETVENVNTLMQIASTTTAVPVSLSTGWLRVGTPSNITAYAVVYFRQVFL